MMPELSPTLREFRDNEELLRRAYLDRQGYPRVLPVWFVTIDGDYYVGTGITSAKWKAMQRDVRVGWVIDGRTQGRYPATVTAKGVSMRGRVEEVRDATWRARVYDAMGQKYFGTTDDAKFIEILGPVDNVETVYLRLLPEDGLTWEY
jgi:nitroimidazol reductase NimA-like FMN-containing flavoprotein (pyridoxamine 5'-phosphate oxidase superfamily)